MKTRKLQLTCPHCLTVHDAISDTGHENPPCENDIVICITCGSLNQIKDGKLALGKPSLLKRVHPKVIRAFRIKLDLEVAAYGEESD